MPITGIRDAIRISVARRRDADDTHITVHHRIPDVHGRSTRARWLITTNAARINPRVFTNAAEVNRRFAEQRAIRCVDLQTMTTTAAIAYHLDPVARLPVLITAIAVNRDARLVQQSYASAAIIKQYLHHIGQRLGRRGVVSIFASTPERAARYIAALRFRRARVPSAWATNAGLYLEQLPRDDP